MGTVISLAEWRVGHETRQDPAGRLERAVEALDGVLRRTPRHPAGMAAVETELLAITGAVSIGLYDDAADRAERLAERLATRLAERSRGEG